MAHAIKKYLIGDTVKVTWVHSGAVPSQINAAIFEGEYTVVESSTMTSSGNGHYYHNYTIPDTLGYYFAEVISWVNSNPYKRRVRFSTVREESS